MLYENDIVKHIERLQVDYLVYSYLYYHKDVTLIPDGHYDNICKWLYDYMKTVKEATTTKYYDLCKWLDASGSGFHIKEEDYPTYIKYTAFKLQMQHAQNSELTMQEIVHMENEDMFKIIVAGSREFKDYPLLKKKLDVMLKHKQDKIIVIVSGMARGADSFGIKYAREKGYYWAEFPADWTTLGGGYARNVDMANFSEACVVFMKKEGTKGSQHMIDIAEERGLQLRVIHYWQLLFTKEELILVKLFELTYMDDCEFGFYLTVGNSKEEVEQREAKLLNENLSCFMSCTANEIGVVEGYRVNLEKI